MSENELSRVSKYGKKAKGKKTNHHPVLLTFFILVILLVIGGYMFTPTGNALIHKNITKGGDTPYDMTVKHLVNSKIKSEAKQNASQKEALQKLNKVIQKTPMTTINKAATDKTIMASLLGKYENMDPATASSISTAVFNDSDFNSLRKAVSNDDWVQVYKQYQKLSANGSIDNLKNTIQYNSQNSSKLLQENASKDLN